MKTFRISFGISLVIISREIRFLINMYKKKIDYFTLTVCLFSWLVVDYYKYLPPNFKDHTWKTVMTKTRHIAFSKAILILVNKRNTPGISYNICSFRLYAVRFFSYGQ